MLGNELVVQVASDLESAFTCLPNIVQIGRCPNSFQKYSAFR